MWWDDHGRCRCAVHCPGPTAFRNGRRVRPDSSGVHADPPAAVRSTTAGRASAVVVLALLGLAAAALVATSFLVTGVPVNQPSRGATAATPTSATSSPLDEH